MLNVKQMVRRQKVLGEFGDLALRSDSLDEVLTEACRLVGEALGIRRAKILEIEQESQSLLVKAGVGWRPDIVGKMRLRMDERSSETFSIKAGKPVISQDIRREERFSVPDFMKKEGVVALANVPIFLPGGRAYGLLQVDDTQPRDFGEYDTEFLRTYTGLLGLVIDRLHQVGRFQVTEQRYWIIVESALDYAILVTDDNGRITDWLPGAQEVFGWTASEAVGLPSSIIFTPEDREADVPAKELAKAKRHGSAPDVRWHQHKDGSRVYIEGTVRALYSPDGRKHGFLKIGQDITERQRTDEQLHESEARQRALVEGLPQLLWRSTDGGMWTWAGPQWTAYTAFSVEASLGLGWLDALHPHDQEAALDAWRKAAADGVLQVDCRIRHGGSGRYAWFQLRGIPTQDSDGRCLEWIGSCTDIDDQVHAREVLARDREELETLVDTRTAELTTAEESLRQAQKMEAVDQLTGGIAHDFNNMLQGVTGGLEMAKRRIVEGRGSDATRYLEAARDAADRAAGLTRRLLAFARHQPLERKPVHADRLVAGLAELIQRTVGPAVAVELRLLDGSGNVLCDPNELESALLNLCINARDAMLEGGRLSIGTDEVRLSASEVSNEAVPGHYVMMSVADTGTGMSPEVLARVFEPFFTTKPQGQGTGLGLSQVWSFVRQSGGFLRIESVPGHGTTVRLYLPLHDIAPTDQEAEATALAPKDTALRGQVLLVDDEDAARGPAADRLREMGLTVWEARDGPEALRILQTSRPDLLVTDVGLPNGMSGRQVAEAVREHIPGLPVLFITGYASSPLPPGADVIGKPFDLDTLALRVQAVLQPKFGTY